MTAVNKWIGEGGKATLVGAPDADILAAAIEILRKRITEGTATFLVKVKAHRGEPANVATDESSSLHVRETMPWGMESNLSRSAFDI